MDIKVLGEGCDRCSQLYENTKAAVEALGIDAQVEKVEDLMEIVKLGVMTAPSLMVDGKLVLSGRTAKKDEIIRILKSL